VFETTEPKAIFEDGHTNKNNNKMSSDMRSVLDLKKHLKMWLPEQWCSRLELYNALW